MHQGKGRYTYIPGSTTGGLVLYDGDTFAYSHHGTDPISGLLVNAFDLVRIHKFGELDEEAKEGTPTVRLPSYLAMLDFARSDDRVKLTMGEEKLIEAQEEFGEIADDTTDMTWLTKLETNRKGEYQATIEQHSIDSRKRPKTEENSPQLEFTKGPVT